MSILQIPSGLTIAGEASQQVYTVQRGAISGSGLQEIRYLDEDGKEYEPDLLPDYKVRDSALPASYDLRDEKEIGKGLPPVRSQSPTGTCWAHATLGSIESELIKSGKANTDIDLSEGHLVWFSNCAVCSDPDDPLCGEGFPYGTEGYTMGGSYLTAIEALAAWMGYETEEHMGKPVNESPEFDESLRYSAVGHVQEMLQFADTDTTAIKTAIMNTGGLYADYYSDDNCYSARKDYYCSDSTKTTNHAILIVGWDDNYAASNFKTAPPGNGAWLCRNSWGERWNGSGYFYISYYDATLSDFISFHAEPADNYDRIYQYDLNQMGWTSANSFSSYPYCSGGNIFTAKEDESVVAVSFFTKQAETAYTVQIYKNVTGTGAPTKGTLAAEISGLELYAGYHTIELPKPVSVREGSQYSVVLSLDKSGIIFDEYSSQSDVSYFGSARRRNGKLEYYGNGWTDTLNVRTENETTSTPIKPNVCLKAFTRTGVTVDEETFPDPVIRQYAASFDTNGDSVLSPKEIAAHKAASVSFANTGVKDIKGLEIFQSIRELDLRGNPIAALDVSGMSLTGLLCTDCVVELGDIACTDLNTLGIDLTKVSGLKGAVIGTSGFVPSDTTISYTYDCGGGFSAVFTLQADSIAHNLARIVSAGEAAHTLICTDCGYSTDEAHTLGDWISSDDGTSHYKTCSICGQIIKEGHSWGKWADKDDTYHTHTCTICGAAADESHRYEKWTSDDAKTHSSTCTVCGHALQEAHTFGVYIDGNAEKHFRNCTSCGYQEFTAHNWKYVINKLRGDHTRTCSDCGRSITEDHTYGEWTINKDGTHTHTCTGCGFAETKAHNFGAYTENADGTHTRTCKDCGYAETSKHTYGDYVQNKDGTHSRTCTACGHVDTAAHTFDEYTAGADGKHSHSCTVCGFTEAAAHQFSAYQDNDDGTHTRTCSICGFAESGSHTYGTKYTITKDTHALTCTKCGHVETTAHTFGEYTDNGNGTHSRVCGDCRYVETTAHSFGKYTVKDGLSVRTCSGCGAAETLMGDATLDGTLDVKDLIAAVKWIHGQKTKGVSTAAMDMNGDGIVDIFDIAILKRILLSKK